MMKYGAEPKEHSFTMQCTEIERRGQWIDIFIALQMDEGETLPEGLDFPSLLIICSSQGEIVQIVLHDEGCDSEFQFTFTEKEKIERFFTEYCRPLLSLNNEL
jgi:hypothetical protein